MDDRHPGHKNVVQVIAIHFDLYSMANNLFEMEILPPRSYHCRKQVNHITLFILLS